MFVRAAIDLDGTEREFVEEDTRTPAGLQALFFDVIALKADRRPLWRDAGSHSC
jgi:hypothetical protein